MKNYVGITRDHSASIASSRLTEPARKDYNSLIEGIRVSAQQNGVDVVASVMKCGVGVQAANVRESVNSSVNALRPLTEYVADGHGTPLFRCVLELISILEASPDANDTEVTFIVSVITDGLDNRSTGEEVNRVKRKIHELQATDRWSFTFRVPKGYGRELSRNFGIPEGNILEWDQTSKGFDQATTVTTAAFTNYYSNLRQGVKSSKTFYTDMKSVSTAEVKAALVDISTKVKQFTVRTATEGGSIRTFCEIKTGKPFLKGAAFYQLTKTEREVQDHKQLIVLDRLSGKMYSGHAAREMLGLPRVGTVRVVPGDHGQWDIFIQSTSVNRKLPAGTRVLYWEEVGTPYTEGPSSY